MRLLTHLATPSPQSTQGPQRLGVHLLRVGRTLRPEKGACGGEPRGFAAES